VPGEIKTAHPDGFYSYAAKYTACEALTLCIPAALDKNLIQRLQRAAVEIFMRVRAGGLARVDFFVQDDKNKIYFNEINTLPGFTDVSMFPKLWEASGLNYSALLDRLIRSALERQQRRSDLITDYASVSQHVAG
jgi:D-alanine-D-alanine ligase